MAPRARTAALAFALALGACSRGGGGAGGTGGAGLSPSASVALASDDEAPAAGPARRAEGAPRAGERVSVPGGSFVAGSTPGDEGRDPATEPVLLSVDLGPFEIDRLPYPNDPAKPPRTGVGREEARSLCQERGARLCTELEWERACKGPGGDAFAAGAAWDATCAREPNACASGFGVLALGGALREWTASDFFGPGRDEAPRAVARGAGPSAEGPDHRCARRAPLDATSKASDLGFRCCKGPPNAAAVPAFRAPDNAFSRLPPDAAKAAALLASSPKLAPYAGGISFYPEQEAVKEVLARGKADAKPGPALTTSPLLWSPAPNEELVVLAVKAQGAAVVAAFYKLPGERHKLASSLVLKDEAGPVVLAFSNFNRRRITWTTCWDCPGEQGAVEYREGRRVVVVHN
ncbi:MAG TPA: SUMF1/EgtB/PvdO family nonheme iron enzyme [Polyangiaceae bacterium]|nr:SUMF1/EgtB/PvdO family nonheme iron enzyme [Polyangiaceae bacterium]